MADDFADGAPVRETAYGAVVNEEVCVELACSDAGGIYFLARIVAVDSEELDAALLAEVDGFLQELAFAGCPENECVSFGLSLFKGLGGEGNFLADVRITMLDDGAVEIYCDDHLAVGLVC